MLFRSTCVGQRLAAEALALAGDNGAIIAYTDAGPAYGTAAGNAQLAAFQSALKNHAKLTIVPPANYETYRQITEQQGLPADVVTELFRRHATARVIVSFVGVPRCPVPADRPAPKLIALDTSGTANWGEWFDHGNLSAVIFSREGPKAQPTDDCAKLFNAWFAIATRDNYRQFQP